MPFLSPADSVKALAPVREVNHRLVLSFIEPVAHSSAKMHFSLYAGSESEPFDTVDTGFYQPGALPVTQPALSEHQMKWMLFG